jgi:DNA invertase Pin-like site-specific DNA recombinase
MTLIAYARVSTADQNPELQVSALRSAGAVKIFTERASGRDRDRPVLAECLQFLRKGDVLLFWKLDRLARSMIHLGQIAEDLHRRGVDLRCLTQPIDTTTSTGKLMFNILASFAEFERDVIVERTNAGLAAARARGKIGGRLKGTRLVDGKWVQPSGATATIAMAEGAITAVNVNSAYGDPWRPYENDKITISDG